MNNNVYEQQLRSTTKTTRELIEEKKRVLELLKLKAILGEQKLSTVSRQFSEVNSAYDKYIPEEPSMFRR